jgi:hypothetical protein
MPNLLLLFVLILTNAGGEGKTTLALLLRSVLDLAGIDSFAIDADPGNWALKNRSGDDVATDVLAWSPRAGAAAKIVANANGKPIMMDAGANMMATGQPIGELVFELQKCFANQGYRTAALIPVSPNKSGAAEGANILSDKIDGFDKFIVLNHRDKSGNFGRIREDLATVTVSHLEPGLQAYLDQHGWRIAHVLTDPRTSSSRAAAHVGEWVRAFASDGGVRSLLTGEVCDLAISRLPCRPPRMRFQVSTLADTSDASFAARESITILMELLDTLGWTPAGLRSAADRLEALSSAK